MGYKIIYNEISKIEQECIHVDSITRRLEKEYEAFLVCVKSCSAKVAYNEVDNICQTMLEVVKMVEEGRSNIAQEKMFELYFNEENKDRLKIFTLEPATSMYRMREANEFIQYVTDSPDEMYHVPFQLRHKVAGSRYSVNGLPVFYLSESVYGCWEELNKTNLDFANVALFKPTKPLLFIDVTLPSDNYEINKHRILSFPLILACRLKVHHKGENYIPEYMVPQILMNCVIQSRGHHWYSDALVGVKYESVHSREHSIFKRTPSKRIFINYAIPTFQSNEQGICPVIKELFQFWDNVSLAEMRYLSPNLVSSKSVPSMYDKTAFGLIEERLNLKNPSMLETTSPIGRLT